MRKIKSIRVLCASLSLLLIITACANPAGGGGSVSKSGDAALAALRLSAGDTEISLSPSFSAAIYSYTANVAYTVISVSVTATTADDGASVTRTGGDSLAEGANTVTVRVTSEDGSEQKTYTIVVTRAAEGASSDATLSYLSIGSSVVSLVSGTLDYSTADVSEGTSSVAVAATANDSSATVSVSGNTNLVVGKNTITITVTAEDGLTVNEYTVSVVRRGVAITSPSMNATITAESFTVSGTYYASGAPSNITVRFGSDTNITAAVSSLDTGTGQGTWSVSIDNDDIATSDYTRGTKILIALATWSDTDTAQSVCSVNYQYAGAATASGYSISGTVSTAHSIPAGYYLVVYVIEDGGDTPSNMTIVSVTASTFPYSYTLENVDDGDYVLNAVVVETEAATEMLFQGIGADIQVASGDLTGRNLVLYSCDATLSELTITDCDGQIVALTPSFSGDILAYTATLSDYYGSFTIEGEANDDNAELEYLDGQEIELIATTDSSVTVRVQVFSEWAGLAGGNSRTYSVIVNKPSSDGHGRNGTWVGTGGTYVFNNGALVCTDSDGNSASGVYTVYGESLTLYTESIEGSSSTFVRDFFLNDVFYPNTLDRVSGTSGLVGTWRSVDYAAGYYCVYSFTSDTITTTVYDEDGSDLSTAEYSYTGTGSAIVVEDQGTFGYILLSNGSYLSIGSSENDTGGYAKQ